jgi:tetratricopeptide (TPR) repeat protein
MGSIKSWWRKSKANNLVLTGTSHALRGEYPAAIAKLTEAIALSPQNLEARLHRGIAFIDSGESAKSLPDFEFILQQDPEYMLAYYNRAIAHRLLGDMDKALQDATRAVELAPRDPVVYNHRTILHSERGEFDAAIADAAMEIELGQEVNGFTNRAVVQEKRADLPAAIADWTEVIRREPNNAKAFCFRGSLREKTGDRAAAMADLRKGLKGKQHLHPDLLRRAEEALARLEPAK